MPATCLNDKHFYRRDQLHRFLNKVLDCKPPEIFNCVHPCPCGYYGDSQKPCTCAAPVVTKYQKRISGPLLNRIDIHIEVPRVDYEKLSGDRIGESSECIRTRVQAARNIQLQRFSKIESSNIVCNADMHIGEIRKFCKLLDDGLKASSRFELKPRRVWKANLS